MIIVEAMQKVAEPVELRQKSLGTLRHYGPSSTSNQGSALTKWGLMAHRCHWDIARPSGNKAPLFHSLTHGTQESTVTQWDLMEASVHCDTAGPDGTQESTVTQWDLMEASVHCDTAGPDGTQESSVTQRDLIEASVHCDTAGPHGIQESTRQSGEAKQTQRGHREARCHLDIARACGTQCPL